MVDLSWASCGAPSSSAQRGDLAAARDEVLSDRGKLAMDNIRRLVGEIIAAESAMGTQRIQAD